MPTVIDPQFGCKYTWNSAGRGDSIVDMENKIFLQDDVVLRISIHRSLLYMHLEPLERPYTGYAKALTFSLKKLGRNGSAASPRAARNLVDLLSPESRELLGDFGAIQRLKKFFFSPERLAQHVAIALEDLCKNTPHGRREPISGPVFEKMRGAKVSISYEGWRTLKKFFNSPCPEETNHINRLSQQIQLLFLSTHRLHRILMPARGRWAGKPVLGDYLPQSYFACRELVVMSRNPSPEGKELETLVTACLDTLTVKDSLAWQYINRENLPEYYYDQLAVVCLVYRAFYGAWDRYGLNGLPEPQDAFRQYLYREKELRGVTNRLKKSCPETYERLSRNSWRDLYLAPNLGAAAKAYALI